MTKIDLLSLGERSVASGEIKHLPLWFASQGIGLFFPGINACLPTVVWVPGVKEILAMHVGSPINSPVEIEAAILDYERNFQLSRSDLRIATARVHGPNVTQLANISGRDQNLQFRVK